MNDDMRRADTIRGTKAVLLLFVVLMVLGAVWQFTSESFHPVFVFLCLAAVWGLLYRTYRGRLGCLNSSMKHSISAT